MVTEWGRTWTEADVKLITNLWNEGVSAGQIAKQLGDGRTKNSVLGKITRMRRDGALIESRPVIVGTPMVKAAATKKRRATELYDKIAGAYQSGIIDVDLLSTRYGLSRLRIVGLLNARGIKVGWATKRAEFIQKAAEERKKAPVDRFIHAVDESELVKGVGGSRSHCQFIPGPPKGADTLYCGKPTSHIYCLQHMVLCYVKPTEHKGDQR
jgi:hypothetical protein